MKKFIRNKHVLKFLVVTNTALLLVTVSAFQGVAKTNTPGSLKTITANNAIATPIRGKVTDSKGTPLVGVTIVEKGVSPSNATVSDIDGNFRISVSGSNSVLEFRYVGYGSQEVTIGSQTSINVSLTELNSTLNEVVVVGYGTQKRATVTGAISSVKGTELAAAPVANITNSLSGRVSGVIARQSGGGQPGNDNTNFSIRGVNTAPNVNFPNNNNPLIVVDGIIRNNINQVDPQAIETVTILKDAAAVAPYGLGGANGVVLITTKTGKTGAPSISINSSYGTQTPTYYPEVLGPQDYMRLRNEAYYNENPAGVTPPYAQANIDNYLNLNKTDPDRYPIGTPKQLIDFHAPQTNQNVQVAGGSDRVKYFTNLGYFNQQGMFDKVQYTRYSYNLNLEASVTNTTKFTISMTGSFERNGNIDPANSPFNLFRDSYKYNPTDALFYSNGLWGSSAGLSPVGVLKAQGYNNQFTNTLLSTIGIEQKLPIKGLSIKGTLSYDPTTQNQKQFHTPYYYYSVNTNVTPYVYSQAISTAEGPAGYTYLYEQYSKSQQFTYQGYLNYHNTFGKNDITGLVVAEARNNTYEFFNARINNYAIPVGEFNFGSSNKNDYSINGNSNTGSQVGYVYRVTDVIMDKYTIEASGRYDGHYYFAPGKQYAYFPAFSANWILSKEKFMQKATWVDYLKLRASWGKSGALAGGPFQFQNGYTLNGNAYAFGNGSLVQGTTPQNQNNPVITWEQAVKSDIGFEATLFGGKLTAEVDVYKSNRTGMLVQPQTTVPGEYGTSLNQVNGGAMTSSGIEVTLGTSHKFENGLYLGINGNFSYANNKLTQVYETAASYNNPNRRQTGRPAGTQFGYHSLGLFQKSDDKNGDGIIDATDGYNIAQFGVLHPGDIKYQDVSGPNGVPDGKIDVNDNVPLGNSPTPLINYGLTVNASWKGFDISVLFQGTAMSTIGTQGFVTVPFNNNNSNAGYEYFNNHWTPATPNALYPRANQAPYSNNTQASDFWIRNGSYLRLRTGTIGYTIPGSVVRALKIKSVRLYFTGQNLFTVSSIKFMDPELGGAGASSGSETNYPIQKLITFGLNATF